MSWDRDRIERALRATVSEVEPPDRSFVDRTEQRLRSAVRLTTPTARPALSRIPRYALPALGVAAALVAMGLLVSRTPSQEVELTPAATVPTTEVPAPSTTSTLVPDPEVLVPPTYAPLTTTTTARPEPHAGTSTTRPPKPPPRPGSVRLTCTAGQPEGRPGVRCEWSPVDGAAGYRLHRRAGDETKVVFQQRNPGASRFIDRDVAAGARYTYEVEALAGDGRSLGHSALVTVTCC